MAVIDLTLDSFKVPAIDGYTPPFGTMVTRTETNKGGLSTVEVNSNVMMPFANMRPKVITEDSSTTAVEYDAKLCFSASLLAGATLELDDGAYEGCRVQITNLSSYTCTVEYNSSTLVSIPTGANVEVLWTGSSWMLSTTGTVATGNVMPPTSSAVHAAIDEVYDNAVPNLLTFTYYACAVPPSYSANTKYTFTATEDCFVRISQSWSGSTTTGKILSIYSTTGILLTKHKYDGYGSGSVTATDDNESSLQSEWIYVRNGESIQYQYDGYDRSVSNPRIAILTKEQTTNPLFA